MRILTNLDSRQQNQFFTEYKSNPLLNFDYELTYTKNRDTFMIEILEPTNVRVLNKLLDELQSKYLYKS